MEPPRPRNEKTRASDRERSSDAVVATVRAMLSFRPATTRITGPTLRRARSIQMRLVARRRTARSGSAAFASGARDASSRPAETEPPSLLPLFLRALVGRAAVIGREALVSLVRTSTRSRASARRGRGPRHHTSRERSATPKSGHGAAQATSGSSTCELLTRDCRSRSRRSVALRGDAR